MARAAAVVSVVLAACALVAPAAQADGDPASDVLITERVFFPYRLELPQSSTEGLLKTTEVATKKGYAVRVALIANDYDLGAVGILWEQPQDYAKFLAQELANYNTDWVLIVMPNGYGIYHCTPKERAGGYQDPCEGAEPTAADERLLEALPTPDESGQDVAAAGIVAVRELAALHGAAVPEDGGVGRILILGGALGLVLVSLGAAFVVYRRRGRA